MSTTNVQLAFGGRWLRELAWLHASDGPDFARDPDLDVIASPIDLVVGRRNVLWRVPDEPLLPFLERWCDALRAIALGEAKRIVSLEASPWHIAMHRTGQRNLALSVFHYGSTAEVELEDVSLPIDALQSATLSALRSALHHAAVPASARPRLTARIEALLVRIADPVIDVADAPLAYAHASVEVETAVAGHGTILTQMPTGFRGLFGYDGAPALDRHAMLAPGVITWTDAAGVVLRCEATPLHVWETIVDGLVAWTKHAPHDGGLETLDAVALQLALVRSANRATVTVGAADAVRMDADALVALVAAHVSDLLRALQRSTPALERHAFLTELQRTSAELVSMPTVPSPTVARVHPPRVPTVVSDDQTRTTLGFPASSVRRVRFARDWSARVSLEAVRSWVLGPSGDWVGVNDGRVTRLSRQHGEPIWVAPSPRRTGWTGSAHDTLFAVGDEPVLRALEPSDGEERWSFPLDATERLPRRVAALPSRGVVFLLDETVIAVDADHGHLRWSWRPGGGQSATRMVVVGSTVCVALSTGRVIGLRIADGRPAWSWASAEPSLRLAACGPLLAVWSRGRVDGSTTLQWMEPDGGSLVARAVTPGAAHRWSASDRGVALLVGAGDGDTLVVGDASRGRWHAEPLPLRAIDVAHHDAMTAVLTAGSLLGIDARGRTRWEVRLPRETRDPRLADTCAARGVVVVRDDQRVAFFEAWSGVLLGEAPAFWEQASRLHVGADGGWLLVESGPDGTAWLHGVPAVGMLAALEGGRRG